MLLAASPRPYVVTMILGLAVAGCGHSSSGSTARGVVPGGVAATASANAAPYCTKLVGDRSLTGMGSALSVLAASPHNVHARAVLRSAAISLRRVSTLAPAKDRPAIASVVRAIDAVASDGLSEADKLQGALTRLGGALEHSCGFPVG